MSKKENKNEIDSIIDATFDHIKNIVDANMVVGQTIELGNQMYIIPVSKINVGLISGGGNLPKAKNNGVTAGSGTGFNIVPVGFITISNFEFNFLKVNSCDDMSKTILDNVFKICEIYASKAEKETENEEKV